MGGRQQSTVRWARWAFAIALAAALCGCASYDDPYYVHSVWRPADASSANADVFYLTDRHNDPNFPGGFDYQRGGAASCGVVHAVVPPAKLSGDPEIFAKETGREPFSCGPAQDELASAIARSVRQNNCDSVLVFVHGFDTGFETAVLRAAQLGSDAQWRCAVAAFSWSSSGQRDLYQEDLERSAAAEPLFAEFLRALAAAGLRTEIVAHSMGTRLVLDALASPDNSGSAMLADQVIFAAADIGTAEDSHAFSALARIAAPRFHRLTLYSSREDAALAIARRLNHGSARLGRDPGVALQDGAQNIDVIDASDAPGDLMGHNYFGLSHEMLADMSLVLADVPAKARLEPRAHETPTLLPGEDGLSYRLNVSPDRAPDWLTRFIRWLVTAFAG